MRGSTSTWRLTPRARPTDWIGQCSLYLKTVIHYCTNQVIAIRRLWLVTSSCKHPTFHESCLQYKPCISLGLHFDSVNRLWPSLCLALGPGLCLEIWAHYKWWPRPGLGLGLWKYKHVRPGLRLIFMATCVHSERSTDNQRTTWFIHLIAVNEQTLKLSLVGHTTIIIIEITQ
jgi:hypothetical protein